MWYPVELAVRRAHQAADRKVESRRAELALVAAPRLPVDDAIGRAGVAQHELDGPIDLAVAAPAALVGQATGVADAGDGQAVLDAMQRVAVLVKPRQRPDRPGREQEAVGVPQLSLRELLGEHRRDRDAREVVVGQRRVAHVGRDQDFVLALPLEPHLAVGEVTGLERRVDDHVVLPRLQLEQLAMGQAEPPGAVVVGGPVGHQRRVGRGACAAARAAPRATSARAPARCRTRRAGSSGGSRRRASPSGSAMYASRMFHSSGTVQSNTCVPLAISVRSSWHVLLEHVERRPHAASGQAAAEREEPLHELVRLGPDRVPSHHSAPTRNVWPLSALGSRRDSSQTAAATSSGVRPDRSS